MPQVPQYLTKDKRSKSQLFCWPASIIGETRGSGLAVPFVWNHLLFLSPIVVSKDTGSRHCY